MSRRLIGSWVVLLGALVAAPSLPAQIVVVSSKSAASALEDLHSLLLPMLTEEQAAPVVQALDQFAKPESTPGLDRSRPLGAYLDLPKQPGQQPSIVAFLPVTDGAAFLKFLAAQGVAVDDQPTAPGFSHQVTPPAGMPPLFALVTPQYAFFTNDATGAPGLRGLKPATLLNQKGEAGFLSLDVRLDRIPPQYKQLFVQGFQQSLEKEKVRRDGEDDATYQGRMIGGQMASDGIMAMVNDGKRLSLDQRIDRDHGRLVTDLRFEATPGSPSAAALKTFGRRESLFRGLGRDSAMGFWSSLPLTESLRKVLTDGFAKARKEAEEKAQKDDDDAAKHLTAKLFDALTPTVEADEIDMGVAIRGPFPKPGQDPLYVVAFGIKVKDGKKIEQTLRDGLADAKPEVRAQVALDLEKAADGVTSIHRVRADDDDDDDDDDKAKDDEKKDKAKDDDAKANAKADDDDDDDEKDDAKAKRAADLQARRFGEPFVYFAFRENQVIAAVGENGLTVVKEILDSATPPTTGPSSPLEITVSMSKLAALTDDANKTLARDAAAEVFQGPTDGKDRVRASLRGTDDALRIHSTLDLPVLRFLAQIGRQVQGAAKAKAAADADR